jgi:hypothetical protein
MLYNSYSIFVATSKKQLNSNSYSKKNQCC